MGYQEFTIEGRNAVIEAYRSGKPIDKLFILDGCQDGPMMTIKREAKKHDTLVKYVTKERLDQLSETGKHQGVIAYAAAYEYATVEEILDNARQKGEAPFLFLLDNIEDPHNLGACLRSADAAGVHAVIVPKDRSAQLNATAKKVACGAAESVPLIRVTNLARTMRMLQEENIWIVGTAGEADHTLYQSKMTGRLALVMGAEGEGMRRLTREHCDELISIPMAGSVSSLNVSIATGICLFEAVRQRS